MKKITVFLLLLLWSVAGYAQSRHVTGQVLDQRGDGLPGAGITIKDTKTGTVTDADGKFELDLPEDNNTIVVQAIGYATQTIKVTGNSVRVMLRPQTNSLDETVVTALAVTREKKKIGYSTNNVGADVIERSGEQNIIEALAAKAPGLNVIQSSGTPGASSKIVLRGYSNFTGENQPLIVVDGIPIDNSTTQPVAGDYPYNEKLSGVNESNRALDINPNDIESITILKGPAAAVLYGQRGGNGAIMITTKKGKGGQKGLGITFSSTVEFSKVNKLPKLQSIYAQGSGGKYNTYSAGDDGIVGTDDDNPGSSNSWGPRMDTTNLKSYDNVDAFFQNGLSFNNDLSISGGSENSSFRLGVANLNMKGVVPNSKLERTSIRVNAETKLADWLSVGAGANYAHTEGRRVQNGSNLAGTMLTLLRTPASFDITDFYDEKLHQQKQYFAIYDNPLFTVHRNPYTDRTDRMFGNIYTKADITKHLNLSARMGVDAYNTRTTQIYDLTSYGDDPSEGKGQVNRSNLDYLQTYTDLILSYNTNLGKDLDVNAFIGYNYWYQESRSDFQRGRNIVLPDFYNLKNTTELYSSNAEYYQRTQAIFAEASFGYKKQLYLTLTGRNEWSTTFGKGSSPFFFPKADLAWVFTQTLPPSNMLSYGKIRAAYSTAAVSPETYTDRNYYTQPFTTDGSTNGNGYPYLGNVGYGVQSTRYPGGLKPQFVKGREIGFDTKWFRNRISFDFTYYNQLSSDVLLYRPIAPSTGYQYEYINASNLMNKGVEITLGGDIIRTNNLNWNVTVNWSKNISKVTEVKGVEQFSIESGFSDIGSFAIKDEPYGVIYGTAWMRDDKGNILVDEDGMAMVDPVQKKIGDPNPDWLANISNVLSYKNITFSFLWDIRKGGDIWNGTYARLNRLGRTEESADRERTYVVEGVYAPGTPNEGQQNTTPVSAAYYYQSFKGDAGRYAAENAIQDGSWVRLRQIGLTYRFLVKKNTYLKYVDLGVNARNLLLFTKYKGVDPETSLTGAGSNIFGYDYFNNPGTKSFSFNIKLGF